MASGTEDGDEERKPAKKEVGGKVYVAEEPAPDQAEADGKIPFAQPTTPAETGPTKPA